MRIIRQSVEEKIGQPVTGKMLGRQLPSREYEAARLDAVLGSFGAKIFLDEISAAPILACASARSGRKARAC